ncbi:MAG: DNA/RNA nuclease SfsA [Pseudomonadota bacterium]
MEFETPLIPGTLVQRYKRFLADVDLDDGRRVTAHCANPGAMMGVKSPGLRVWLEPNDNPKRKLKFAWRLVEIPGAGMVGVDTGVPNRIVAEALAANKIAELSGYSDFRPEQRYGTNSRIDFLLTGGGPDTYLEVKNCHLIRTPGLAEFPDCVTARGAKHLEELARMVEAGHRAVMLYVVQRTDCDRLTMAADLDPVYAEAFVDARARGVQALAYRANITTKRISLEQAVPVLDPDGSDRKPVKSDETV